MSVLLGFRGQSGYRVPGGDAVTSVGLDGRTWSKTDYSRFLRSTGICLFGLAWDLPLLPSLLFLPFRSGKVCPLGLSHQCILEAHNLCSFTDSWLERNLPWGESTSGPSQTWFRWYWDRTLDFRLRGCAGMSKGFRGCWGEIQEFCMWEGHEFGGTRDCNYKMNCVLPRPQFLCWNPDPPCDYLWR